MKRALYYLAFFLQMFLFISETPLIGAESKIVHSNVFPNIDFYVQEGENLNCYEWRIKPGGVVSHIHFLNINSFPDEPGHWVLSQPEAYQWDNGEKRSVKAKRVKYGVNEFGFLMETYNSSSDLYIRQEMEKCFTIPVSPCISRGSTDETFENTTYYIRTDGGTSQQCNGTSDAPYPGSGIHQSCAWSHPFWALDNNGNWKIKGGDTIIIGPGSYKMGYGAPNTSWCNADGAFDCVLPPLPSGPDSSNPTRFLGKGWSTGCSNPPELWGTQRPWQIIDLTGSSNAIIDCLEITDHSDCVEFHANSAIRCNRDNYPFGEWASNGILATDAANITLKNLDIHGLASAGIQAGRLSNWTIENVKIAGNGWVGWEGDVDGNDSNSGTLHFKQLIIEWNGCGESYPERLPHNCWSQTAGGYGDGLGTGTTGGYWIFEDSIFRFNTSDGLDLLYARESGSRIEIKRTMSYGNAGNEIKVNGNTAIQNSLIIGNCGFFNGKSFTYDVDDCRALGNALSFTLKKGSTFSMVNSTVVGQGDCLISGECEDNTCDGTEKIILQNNAFQGYADYLDPLDTTCYLWLDSFNYYNLQMDYNIHYHLKISDQLTLNANEIKAKPFFQNDSLESFDGHLKESSPAIDSGIAVGGLNGLIPGDDLENHLRPTGTGVDRGAYEYQSGAITPSITVTSPTGGETWLAGSIHTITWNSTGAVGNVSIRYTTNNGASWTLVVSSTSNDGSYSWTVPDISSSLCLVKISEVDGHPTDSSDSVFTITSSSSQKPVITVSKNHLNYGAQGTVLTSEQYFFVINSGYGTLNWAVSSDRSWLKCNPGTGTNSGIVTVTINQEALSAGIHNGNITISDENAVNSPQIVAVTLAVYNSGNSNPPFGVFDTPVNGSTVRSSVPVTGWALDDVQVSNIKIYRKSNNSRVYIGDATFVDGARPDVELGFPESPFNYRAGWGYMLLTYFLPNSGNGPVTLEAVAFDLEGNQRTIGSGAITCDNASAVNPFGAIDTPTQGGKVSGNNFINWGWALTPQPNRIPIDGNTINIYVDGINFGHPVYNIYRSDIAALFPGYFNSNGAAGYFILDTTSLENGLHTIQWTVRDDAGNIDGIGSRYFTIQNVSQAAGTTKSKIHSQGHHGQLSVSGKLYSVDWATYNERSSGYTQTIYREPLFVRTGYDKKKPFQAIYPDKSGIYIINISQLDLVEISIKNSDLFTETMAPPNQLLGYQLVGDTPRQLPVGSTLLSTQERFLWMPGPGYFGKYYFVFLKEESTSDFLRINVLFNIIPKF